MKGVWGAKSIYKKYIHEYNIGYYTVSVSNEILYINYIAMAIDPSRAEQLLIPSWARPMKGSIAIRPKKGQ